MPSSSSSSGSSAREALRRAEEALVRGIPGCRSLDVPISDGATGEEQASVHAIELDLRGPQAAEAGAASQALVLLPGYGLGAGVGTMFLESLLDAASPGGDGAEVGAAQFDRAFVLDWPGAGLSSGFDSGKVLGATSAQRPDGGPSADDAFLQFVHESFLEHDPGPSACAAPTGAVFGVARSEAVGRLLLFFCHSLEQWRRKVGIQQMTLVGHSLGGYLAFCYCEWLHERSRTQESGARALGSVVPHLILASPCGMSVRPDFRSPPLSEEEYREERAQDLAAGSRPLSEFDDGSRNRRRFARIRCMLWPLLCLCGCLCGPCAAAAWCLRRCCRERRPPAGKEGGAPPQGDDAPPLDAPISQAMRRARWGWLRGLGLRFMMRARLEDNGQWARGRRDRLRDYMHRTAMWNAGLGEPSHGPAFSELLFDRLMFPWSYSSFGWTRAPLTGDCGEAPLGGVDFFGSGPGGGEEAKEASKPLSDGRVQRLLRAKATRLSFLYGDEDWMDLRTVADARREARRRGEAVPIAQVPRSGHQLPLDNPAGLARGILALARAAAAA